MRLASHIVRFDMRGIPVIGNTASGALVGLTPEGAELCDAMLEREVAMDEVPAGCKELVLILLVMGLRKRLKRWVQPPRVRLSPCVEYLQPLVCWVLLGRLQSQPSCRPES